MITTLLILVIAALILYLIYYIIGKIAPGIPTQIVGIILVIVFLLIVLHSFGVFASVRW